MLHCRPLYESVRHNILINACFIYYLLHVSYDMTYIYIILFSGITRFTVVDHNFVLFCSVPKRGGTSAT